MAKTGCETCKFKGLPVADPEKRCTNPDVFPMDKATLAIVGGYVCSCSKFEPNNIVENLPLDRKN